VKDIRRSQEEMQEQEGKEREEQWIDE